MTRHGERRGGRHENGSFYHFRDGSVSPVSGKGGRHARKGCALVALFILATPAMAALALAHWIG